MLEFAAGGLVIAANTAYAAFELLGASHARDQHLPRFLLQRANRHGNVARWINTGCEPNAVAYVHSENKKRPDPKKDRVFIEALRAIKPGEEITYDYGFSFEVPYTVKLLRTWACHCGSPKCRGTMLKGKKVREVIKKHPDWRKGL